MALPIVKIETLASTVVRAFLSGIRLEAPAENREKQKHP
jgi:hypothetical protein